MSSSVYDAYGVETATFVKDQFGWNGRWGYIQDRETGLSYCQNRYYDPEIGRWLTRDPIGAAGGINVYGYCVGGPVGRSDPSGLVEATDLAKIEDCLYANDRADLLSTLLASWGNGSFHRNLPSKVSGPNGQTNSDVDCSEIIDLLEGLQAGEGRTDVNHRRPGGKRRDDKGRRFGMTSPCSNPQPEPSGINPWLIGGAIGLGVLAIGLAIASGGAAIPAEIAAAEASGGVWGIVVTGAFVA